MKRILVSALLLVSLLVTSTLTVFASPPIENPEDGAAQVPPENRVDNKPDPLTTRQLELKEKGMEAKLNGKAFGRVHEVARGQYVELAREGEGALWTLLGEFADFPHNNIAEPDRAVNNSTIWAPDFSRDYFMDLLFNEAKGANSMRNFYIEQSSGRYTVYGDVTDWVMVPNNAAYYDDVPDTNVWNFLADSVNGWYANQIAAGMTPEEINAYLSQFDVWDRYDYDGDGNFDEPDGYIDTFQSVHAGEGEEAGGGALGETAIWSHSWYANYQDEGVTGPAFNLLGGIQVGDSDYWVGKYTIQPENGGVGVFAHEYGHDLGLPDLYDYYGENSTGFWTLMSSGSWLNDGTVDIGSKPNHMGVWEKFQLGWLKYDVARVGRYSTHRLGPMEYNTKQAQGLFVILPPKPVEEHIADPFAGENFYFSGSANNLRNQMTKTFTLGAGAMLTAKVNYGIEEGYDFANVIASTDGGATWQTLHTNLSNSPVEPNGIEGFSDGWVDLVVELPFTGDVMLGFKYTSDGGVNEAGFMIDDILVSGYELDGAETDAGWTFTGFVVTTGTENKLYPHYYVAEYRTYKGYDSTLKVGPYYFGYLDNPVLANFVDHFAYQDGLLINYWDTSQEDNNTGLHPGEGLLLPVDAHPKPLVRVDDGLWRNRIQAYDATFTIARTDGIRNIHHNSVLSPVPSLPGVRVFDDRLSYYDPANPLGSVITPKTGTTIRIQSFGAQNSFMQVEVRPVK